MEDCLFCKTKKNISVIDTIHLCNNCCDTYRKTENKMELIEEHIKRERNEMDAARSTWEMRAYTLVHNQAKHLIETDEDCIYYKKLTRYHVDRTLALMKHPTVQLKYLSFTSKKKDD